MSCCAQALELVLFLCILCALQDLFCHCGGDKPNSWISCFPTLCRFLNRLLLLLLWEALVFFYKNWCALGPGTGACFVGKLRLGSFLCCDDFLPHFPKLMEWNTYKSSTHALQCCFWVVLIPFRCQHFSELCQTWAHLHILPFPLHPILISAVPSSRSLRKTWAVAWPWDCPKLLLLK